METLRFVKCDSVGDDCVLCVCVEGGQELEMDEDSLRLWLHMAVGRRAEGEASAKTLNSFRLASIAASH